MMIGACVCENKVKKEELWSGWWRCKCGGIFRLMKIFNKVINLKEGQSK